MNNYRRFLVEVGYIPENEEFAEIRVTDTKNLDSDSDADSGWDTESDRNRDNESEFLPPQNPERLLTFLKTDCAAVLPRREAGIKRGRTEESHWSTGDDKDIAHVGKIDSGAMGDVHRVGFFSPIV